MTYNLYNFNEDALNGFAIKNYLLKQGVKDSLFLINIEEKLFQLVANTKSEYFDVYKARKDGYLIYRDPDISVSPATIIAFDEVIWGMLVTKKTSKNKVLSTIKKGLNGIGIRAKLDTKSLQQNDLTLEEEKIVGVGSCKGLKQTLFPFFITIKLDKSMLSYFNQPLSKFEGKTVETAERRCSSGISRKYPNIKKEDIIKILPKCFIDNFDCIDKFEEAKLDNIDWDEIQQIKNKMINDKYIFSK